MSIIKNAVDSIQVGVEDYKSQDVRRQVSAVRNISAGILLLYKEKLCRLSPLSDPHLLILKDIRPTINADGSLGFKGFVGKNGKIETVNVGDIQKLFGALNIKTDWDRFNKMIRLRNDVEHFYASEEPDVIREIVSSCFLLIRNFLIDELNEEPLQLVGSECWKSFLDVSEMYERELELCKVSLSQVNWPFQLISRALRHLRCVKCPSALIKIRNNTDCYPNIQMACSSCGHEFLFSEVVEQCVHGELFSDAYEAMTQGGEFPWEECEECGRATFVVEESTCMHCCWSIEYERCLECKEPVGDYGREEGLCDFCVHVHEMMQKD